MKLPGYLNEIFKSKLHFYILILNVKYFSHDKMFMQQLRAVNVILIKVLFKPNAKLHLRRIKQQFSGLVTVFQYPNGGGRGSRLVGQC